MSQESSVDGLLVSVYPGECSASPSGRRAAAAYIGELLLDAWLGTDEAPARRPESVSRDAVSVHARLTRDDRAVLVFDQGRLMFVSDLPDSLRKYAIGLLQSHARRGRSNDRGPPPQAER